MSGWYTISCSECSAEIHIHEDWSNPLSICKSCKEDRAAQWYEKSCEGCGSSMRIHRDWDHPPRFCKSCKSAHDEKWYEKSIHFKNIIHTLMSPNFEYMITFIKDFRVPRSSNSETLIKLFRQWEKVRFGFRTEKGLLDHLKLYQITHYLP